MTVAAPVGAIVSIYYDAETHIGDVIRTTTGRCYRVGVVRVQRRGRFANRRRHLLVHVIDPSEVADDDTVRTLRWYPRGKRSGRP